MSDVADLWGKPLRVLTYDIEVTPIRVAGFAWDLKLRSNYLSPDMVEQDKHLICWSAKFNDSPKVHSAGLTVKEAKAHDDTRIATKLAELIQKADIILAHNGDRYDLPTLNTRLLVNELTPLGDVQTLDTLKIARASLKPASNRLDYLARMLGFDGKKEVSQATFEGCYHGDAASLRQMRDYNRHDSVLLEHVWHRIKPYAKKLPRLVDGLQWRDELCPYCGSRDREKLVRPHRTGVSNFLRYRCQNCQRTYRGWQSIGAKKMGSAPV